MKKPAYLPRPLHSLPQLFMLAFIALLGSAAMVKAEAAQYQPVECQSPEPRSTQVWKNFEKFVNEEYANKRRLNGEVNPDGTLASTSTGYTKSSKTLLFLLPWCLACWRRIRGL